jgi:hypothetical protein
VTTQRTRKYGITIVIAIVASLWGALGLRGTYCFDCHDSASAKGDIDLESALTETPLVRNRLLWENVAERVKMGDMPPRKRSQPADSDRLKLRVWLALEIGGFDYRKVRNPGYIQARRLTREEYNRTIHDLVGLDLRPADDFPMDFSGTSGFSNSANTLFLQTTHLAKFSPACRGIVGRRQRSTRDRFRSRRALVVFSLVLDTGRRTFPSFSPGVARERSRPGTTWRHAVRLPCHNCTSHSRSAWVSHCKNSERRKPHSPGFQGSPVGAIKERFHSHAL